VSGLYSEVPGLVFFGSVVFKGEFFSSSEGVRRTLIAEGLRTLMQVLLSSKRLNFSSEERQWTQLH
ncbi:hypothetical protein AVEN_250328-1, partial [Araneus ventricosus]